MNCSISSLYSDKCQALVNVVMNLWVPYNVGNFLTSLETTSFSRITLFYGINTLWTGDADLRLYITTVQDG